MNTQTQNFTIVNDTPSLKALAKANKIKWPVLTNWPADKKPYPRYVDEIEAVGSSFTHNGTEYWLKYHSGSSYPYLYRATKKTTI